MIGSLANQEVGHDARFCSRLQLVQVISGSVDVLSIEKWQPAQSKFFESDVKPFTDP